MHFGPFGDKHPSAASAEQAYKDSLKLGDSVKASEQRQRSKDLIRTPKSPPKK